MTNANVAMILGPKHSYTLRIYDWGVVAGISTAFVTMWVGGAVGHCTPPFEISTVRKMLVNATTNLNRAPQHITFQNVNIT